MMSTDAARSKLGQGVSCFSPAIVIAGDDHSAFFLFEQLLDGLVTCAWEKRANIEACKAEFQSFVRDQRQLDGHASRKHYDISSVLSYFTHQSGFWSRQHSYLVSSVCLHVVFLFWPVSIVTGFMFSN